MYYIYEGFKSTLSINLFNYFNNIFFIFLFYNYLNAFNFIKMIHNKIIIIKTLNN